MKKRQTNPNFMNGVPELLILNLLSKREMYGYALVKEIKASSKGKIVFEEGCIYPTLHALESGGCIVSKRKPVNGRTRYYYRLRPRGKSRLAQLAKEWMSAARGIDISLGGVYGEPATV